MHRTLFSALRSLLRLRLLLLLAVCLAPCLPARPAYAATAIIYVNRNVQGPGDDPGISWKDPVNTIPDAIFVALSLFLQENVEKVEIWVAAGVYYPDEGYQTVFDDPSNTISLINNIEIYGGFTGTEGSREERDWVKNVTVLSGDIRQDDEADAHGIVNDPSQINPITDNSYHVVSANETNATAVLDGFTITAGSAEGAVDNCPDRCGGGIYLYNSSPTLANLVITGNSAKYGGGMTTNILSTPAISDVAFKNNLATHGGGIYIFDSTPTLSDVSFSGNKAMLGKGGGIYSAYSTLTLTNVTLGGNQASYGGGIYSYYDDGVMLLNANLNANRAEVSGGGMYSDHSNPTINNTNFNNNKAVDHGGGMVNDGSSPTINNANFTKNEALVHGGGMYNYDYSSPALTNVTFSGNRAGLQGGGMVNYSSSKPTLTNVIFSGNRAGSGGGMLNEETSPTLTNVTFSGNQADQGGGMYTYGSILLLQNSILWDNRAPNDPNFFSQKSAPRLRYSLIQGGFPAGTIDDGHNLFVDPLFVRAVNCGGDGCTDDPDTEPDESANDDYGDLHLQAASPALDGGDNIAIGGIATDRDGAPRKVAVKQELATVDLGAYERANTVTAHAGGTYSANEGGPVALDGTASSDEATIASYAWDCTNNGSVEFTSASPTGNSCTYPDDGSFTVRLTVTDMFGLPGTATAPVNIVNVSPSYTAAPNQSTAAGTATSFLLGSIADPGADAPWQVTINWGDNSPTTQFTTATTGALPDKVHTFAAPGTYNVVVTTNDGGGNGSGGFQVVVNPAPPGSPTVTASANQTASPGVAESFVLGSFSDANDPGPWQITVEWGDGSDNSVFNAIVAGALPNQSHTYAGAGIYDVLVVVNDGDFSASTGFQVEVSPVSAGNGVLYLPALGAKK